MAGTKADVEKLLDISSITSSRGFVVSSSDEEDNAAELNKISNSVGSRLAGIFGVPSRKSPTPDSPDGQKSSSSANRTIFATSAIHFSTDAEGKTINKSAVGAAVILHNGQYALIVYNQSKQRIASFLLSPGSLNISIHCKKGCYLSISSSSSSSSLSLFFIETEQENLSTLVALIVILCQIEKCDLCLGFGDLCLEGNHVLFDAVSYKLEDNQIQKHQISGEKAKLSPKATKWIQEIQGMSRGGTRIIRESENSAMIVFLKKIKNNTQKEVKASESETSSQVGAVVTAELSDLEEEAQELEERTNDVLSRVARLGHAVIPTIAPVPEKTDAPIAAPRTHCPTSVSSDYSAFHQVVGTEVDRLEIRLEAAVQRMIDRSLEPILKEMKSISETQQLLLEELRRQRDKN